MPFRFAREEDVPELLEVYKKFYSEAVYKDYLTFDPERAAATIRHGIATDQRPHILAVVDEEIVGFISYVFDHSFSIEPCAVLMELYVLPEHRRGALGRGLVGLAILEAEQRGAGCFHAPIASGMSAARTLCNLLVKASFEPMGFVMRRRIGRETP